MQLRETAVEPLSLQTLDEAITFLATEPIANAGLIATLGRARTASRIRQFILSARAADGTIGGVVMAGPQTLLSTGRPEAFTLLGEDRPDAPSVRALIGPANSIAAYRAGAQGALLQTPRMDTDQLIMVRRERRDDLLPQQPHVREALHADREAVGAGAAEMIVAELGYDPRARPTFAFEIAAQIASRRWWLAEDEQLRLLCRTGAVTPETMTLECVWSPEASRGQGYATRALAQICAILLERRPSLSLAVGSRNTRALALYERLGFVPHGRQRTLLW